MKQEMENWTSSKDDGWITPPELIADIKEVLGYIDLDPASSPEANEIVGANKIFTIEDDALTKNWSCQTCFMNPPFCKIKNKSQAGIFCDYFGYQYALGIIKKGGIILTHDRTGYNWFNELSKGLISVTLWDRTKFVNPSTMKQGGQAKTAQTLFVLGDIFYQKFIEKFEDKGRLYVPKGM